MNRSPAALVCCQRGGEPRRRTMNRASRYRTKARLQWSGVAPEVIQSVAELCDGHTIFDPVAFTGGEVQAPPAIIAQHTRCFTSGRTPKSVIANENGMLSSLVGVYGLEVLMTICSDLGITVEEKIGRGSQAAVCKVAIRKHFAGKGVGRG